ncbi:hypothetical protein ECD73_03215, partial [Acinetobacter baumannii]|nr:hypothetical protein [Acinetobacter baumannii]
WIIIDAKVYDVSKFANLHPGGANVLFAPSIGEDSSPLSNTVHMLLKPGL